MFRCLVVTFGLLSMEIQGQQLQLLHSEASQNQTLVSIRELAGRKTRIAQDLPNATLTIWGDTKENYLFGEKYRDLLGPAIFPSFDSRVHYLNYGFFYAISNENIRFIPLPIGHHCQGRWLQYGKVRGVFLFYDNQYRFGSYCLKTGVIAFLDKHGNPMVFESNSEVAAGPYQHTGFYQICIGKNRQPITKLVKTTDNQSPLPHLPHLPSINSNCTNGINCYPHNSPNPIQVPQNPSSIYNFACENDEFSVMSGMDCNVKNGQPMDSQEPIPPLIPFPPQPRLVYPSFVNSVPQDQHSNSAPNYGRIGKQLEIALSPLSPPFDPHYEWQQSNADKTGIDMIRFFIFFNISIIILSIL